LKTASDIYSLLFPISLIFADFFSKTSQCKCECKLNSRERNQLTGLINKFGLSSYAHSPWDHYVLIRNVIRIIHLRNLHEFSPSSLHQIESESEGILYLLDALEGRKKIVPLWHIFINHGVSNIVAGGPLKWISTFPLERGHKGKLSK
jgi:hypothetical protein